MDASSLLCLSFIALTAFHVLAVLIGLVRGYAKLPLESASWNFSRIVTCAAFASTAVVAVAEFVQQQHNKRFLLDGSPYQSAVAVSIATGSLASLTLSIFKPFSSWQALYGTLACINWALISTLVTTAGKIAYLLTCLYLVALITTLSVPYESSAWRVGYHPLEKTALLPTITLSWLDPLIKRAAREEISADSLWPVTGGLSLQDTVDNRPQPLNLRGGLSSILIRNFTWPFCFSALLAIGNLLATFSQPFLLRSLLQDRDALPVIGLFTVSIIGGICEAHVKYYLRMIGLRIRSLLTASLCDQGLHPVKNEDQKAPEPSVLIEVDLPRVFDLVEQAHLFWMVPLQALISLAGLVYLLGWQSVAVSLISPLILLPALLLVMKRIQTFALQVMEAKDARISLVTQVLKQVRQVKLAALQDLFRGQIAEAREIELQRSLKIAFSNASMTFIVWLLPAALILLSFGSFSAFNGRLTSEVVFPALALLSNVGRAVVMLPRLIMLYLAGSISLDRVRSGLSSSASEKLEPIDDTSEAVPRPRVVLQHCDFEVPGSALFSKPILHGCSMDVSSGSLNAISGPVGSGKTTLLRSILGDANPSAGYVQVSGRVAYASQKAFLINGTVRDNILFGAAFYGHFYDKVLDAVALRHDLMRLPEGDSTMLGGTSVALSGGQMSRVALARAIYSRREIVILDDPLAALDGHVRRHVVDRVLGPRGILKDTLRIVTTSSQELLDAADNVFVISQGTLSQDSAPLKSNKPCSNTEPAPLVPRLVIEDCQRPTTAPQPQNGYGSLKSAITTERPISDPDSDIESTPLLKKTPKVSITSDTSNQPVSFSTYKRFLLLSKRGGWLLVLIVAAASRLLDIISLYFLKASSEEYETQGHSNKLLYYALCAFCGACLSGIFVLVVYYMCFIPASRMIHAELTEGVLGSKFAFFDKTPLGQVMNRFTNDINKMDGPVSGGFINLGAQGISALSSILVIVATSLFSIVYLLPIGAIYFTIQSHYLHSCRQLRRLENVTRGPILNIAGEIKTGAPIILSYGQAEMFRDRVRKTIDDHIQVWGPFLALDVWLILRLQVLASMIQLLSACLLIAIKVPPSTLGLVMNFIIQITMQFNLLIGYRANLEADIISAERIWNYAANPREDDVDEIVPPSTWSQSPSIVFDSFTAYYVPGGVPCLKSLDFVIEPGHHIAVVGRTGAGKSSLTMALLRALDQAAITSGEIRINGLDISQVDLSTLRKRITLVPQEPMVFDGTLRFNLDPEGKKTDEELLEVAEVCHVRQLFNLDDATNLLEHSVSTKSASLSEGQIQILALARAILAQTKIVILDEAAAAMDTKTKKVVHDLMKRRFQNSTVITITHHLDSVMDYDKILVLGNGRVVDYDEPDALLQKEDSILARLVKETHKSS